MGHVDQTMYRLFRVTKGPEATKAWLLAFVVGFLQVRTQTSPLSVILETHTLCFMLVGTLLSQDLFVYAPIAIIFWSSILPLLVRQKIRDEIDAARKEPFVFKAAYPPGTSVGVSHQARLDITLKEGFGL